MSKITTPSSPTTTVPVTTPTVPPATSTLPKKVIPGSEDITAGESTWSAVGGISYAGGINPNYKGLSKDPLYLGADSTKPYTYTNDDWQTILGYDVNRTMEVQKQLMKAFPGFVPGALGDSRDPKTVATFKKALARINMVSQDPSSSLRGKKLEEAIVELGKTPTTVTGASTRLPSYQMTSPSDLKAVFKKAAQDTIGRTLGEGDLNRLVETYQAQQVQYQKQLETGGSMVTQVPSAESFINRNIEKDFGTEVNTQKLDNIFGAIDQALTGGQQ